jgi:hypothetical protein
MKIFTRVEVEEKIKEFSQLMAREKELQAEILNLQIYGSKDHTKSALKRHDEIVDEIDDIRMGKMIPIIDELAAFVSYCQKVENGSIQLGEELEEAT